MRFGFHHGRHERGHNHDRNCGPRGFGRGGLGGPFGGMGHPGREGRGRRMFDGGEIRLILLKLIEESPRHGYDLIREIEERTGGAYAPSPGVVYPTLTMLDDMDLIAEHKAEGAKKSFAITEAGTAHLAEHADQVAALFERLAHLASHQARTDGGPIRRAMGNLRVALQNRVSAEGVDANTLHDVAAILDEAAQKIERLA